MTPKPRLHATPHLTAAVLLLLVAAAAAVATQDRQAAGWKPVEGRLLSRASRATSRPRALCPSTRARSWCARRGRTSTVSGSTPSGRPTEEPGRLVRRQHPRPLPARVGALRRQAARRARTSGSGTAAPSACRRLEGQARLCCTSAPSTGTRRCGQRQQVGEHTGGYDPFTFDITDALAGRRRAGTRRLGVGPDRRRHPAARQAGPQAAQASGTRRHRHLADRLAGAGAGPGDRSAEADADVDAGASARVAPRRDGRRVRAACRPRWRAARRWRQETGRRRRRFA